MIAYLATPRDGESWWQGPLSLRPGPSGEPDERQPARTDLLQGPVFVWRLPARAALTGDTPSHNGSFALQWELSTIGLSPRGDPV